MKILASLITLIALTAPAIALSPTPAPTTVSSGRLHDVRMIAPDGAPKAMVVYFSGRSGWASDDDANADALKNAGNVVLGVDLASYANELDKDAGACLYVVGEITDLAQKAQRSLGIQTYLAPVLAGAGQGATFAYAALADAPFNTLGGAVASGFTNQLTLRLPFCPGSKSTRTGDGKSWSYGFDVPMRAAATLFVEPALVETFREQASSQSAIDVEEFDTGSAAAQMTQAVSALSETAQPFGSLPAVDLPGSNPPKALAIFVSGDGGWRDIDKTMGEWLATQGVHVVGLDALHYFWSKRTPEQFAADLRTLIADANPQGDLPILLIGFSFGADTLPFAYTLLPPEIQDRIRTIGLISPSQTTSFQVTVTGWLGIDDSGYDVPGAIATLPKGKVLCMYGEEEPDSGCTSPAVKDMTIVKSAGGHHLDGNYPAIAGRLLAAAGL